jgi:hypothetical protein
VFLGVDADTNRDGAIDTRVYFTMATLDSIQRKYASKGKHVETSLDGASLDRLNRLSGRLGDSH